MPLLSFFGFEKHAEQLIALLAAGLIILAGFFVSWFIGKLRDMVMSSLAKRINGKLHATTAEGHRKINNMLHELLTHMEATRANVFQFHNGSSFHLSNHAWRVSCTHEVLDQSSRSCMRENQNLPIAGMLDVVSPLMGVFPLPKGVREVKESERCVIVYDFSEMPVSVGTAIAYEQGVGLMVATPLKAPCQSVFGYVTLTFRDTSSEFDDDLKACMRRICAVADTIQIYLTSEFLGPKTQTFWQRFWRSR